MLRSFRTRLALLSVLISGLVVVAFGSVAWWTLSRSSLEALDADLRHFGFRVALRTGPNVDTERLETSLTELLGAERARNRFFTLLTSDREPIFASARWPKRLDARRFAPGEKPLNPQPVDHYRQPAENRFRARAVMEPRFYTTESEAARY
ncbi:MAG: hypothetical protein AAGJ79_09345, partial [Verrucomicrobiota bacterium]